MKKNSKKKYNKKVSKKIKRINRSLNILELISENKIEEIIKNIDEIKLNEPIHLNIYLIHYAGYLNRLDLLKAILKKDDIWDYKNENGFTVAHIASSKGFCEILSYLYEKYGTDIFEKLDNKGNNIISYLVDFPNCLEIFKKSDLEKYINNINNDDQTPLSIAINKLSENIEIKIEKMTYTYRQINIKKYNHNYDQENIYLNTIDILLKNNVDIDTQIGKPALILATSFDILVLVKKFIKKGCNMNIRDKGGKLALGWAIYNCNYELVKLLIENGANVDQYSFMGEGYLPHVALTYSTNEIIDYIFEQKINYNYFDYEKNTLGHIIAKNGGEFSSRIIQKIIKNTDNLNMKNLEGNTIGIYLWQLPYEKLEKLSNILVNKRIDIYTVNKEGKNILSYILHDQFKNILDYVISNGIKNQLKEKKYIIPEFEDINDLIYNKKISYLKTKEEEKDESLENSIQITEYEYANNNIFKNLYFDDIIMYILIYLRNSEDLIIPLADRNNILFVDNKYNKFPINFKTNMIDEHFKFMLYLFPEFLPIDIIWYDKDHYVFTETHEKSFKETLKKPQRFIFIMLGYFLSESTNGHANILLYDKNMKILERFDPEGIIDVKKIEDMDIFLKNKFKTLVNDDNFKYISPKDYGIINSFQKLSDEINSLKRKVGDVKGYCQAWVFWYVEMRILNKNINPIKLVDKLLNRLIKMDITILEYIRNYANNLRNEVNEYIIEAGISERIVNNEKYPEESYKIIANNLLKSVQESM